MAVKAASGIRNDVLLPDAVPLATKQITSCRHVMGFREMSLLKGQTCNNYSQSAHSFCPKVHGGSGLLKPC